MNIINEIEKILIESKKPSDELRRLINEREEFNEYPLKNIRDLKNMMQNIKHHPEGDVLSHTLMVVDEAAKIRDGSKDKRVFMWSALLHDVGKLKTTKKRNGRLTAYDHDKVGAEMVEEMLIKMAFPKEDIQKIVKNVRWHMQPLFVVNNLPFQELEKMVDEVDIHELSALCRCDRLGRGKLTDEQKKLEKDRIYIFKEKALRVKKEKKENYSKI